ncbi:zinc finger and BTB domain-containing protein 49-like isoform X18 [Maniola jurtina]|uniref:zinc finger and BTB domain-containing protein 49-like isoform X18 n=1 Tax=Maniola jurtina TaxID=191418 RepID=UPI001E68B8DC|nr:zinc finger and BTB domain-containing protein 49-like isoform X18 [Maniola jurtina]XP_045781758.1 zinc finger and BTB domain-containing protein 49-like isoform X18 [Maniola jurtina]
MATKTWKIEKDLCRCCHAEGAFDNLAEPRTFLDKVEVYSDMLRECLDIDIPPVPGELCAITYTICNACIARLRDACNFKKQVQDCEQRFMTLYYKNAIQGLKPATKVKEEIEVSIERPQSDTEADNIVLKKEDEDDDDDHFLGGDDDDGMSDDDLPIKPPKQSVSTMKTRPKPKPKPKAPPVVKKLKPPPKPKKKEEPKPAKEKKGPIYYTITNDSYVCNVCEKVYASQPLVSQHYRFVHLKRRPKNRKCPYCPQKIPTHQRRKHLEEKHSITAPTCGVCDRKFRYPCELDQHQKKVHLGERRVVCEICDKRFFDDIGLRLHMSIHSVERRFSCGVCEKQFRWENNLKEHLRIHAGDRRYGCLVCGKAFVQRSTLKKHEMTHLNLKLSVSKKSSI